MAISIIQQVKFISSGTSAAATVASSTSGSRWVLIGEVGSSSVTMSSISVGTWTAHPRESLDGASTAVGRRYMRHATDVGSGVTTITITLSGTPSGGSTWLLVELSGANGGADAPASADTGSSALTHWAGTCYPTKNDVFIIASFGGRWATARTITPDTAKGFTALTTPDPGTGAANPAQLRAAYKQASYGPQIMKWSADTTAFFGLGLSWAFYPSTATDQPIKWMADFEDGTTDALDAAEAAGGWNAYGGYVVDGNASIASVTDWAHEGTKSLRQRIITRHSPTSASSAIRYAEANADQVNGRWYSGWYRLPSARTPNNSFWTIFEVLSKSTGGAVGPHLMWILGINASGNFRLVWDLGNQGIAGPHNGESGQLIYTSTIPIVVGADSLIEIWIKPSDGYTGEFKVYVDGVLIFDHTLVRTSYTNTDWGGTVYAEPRWMNYSDGFTADGGANDAATTDLYWDKLSIATSRVEFSPVNKTGRGVTSGVGAGPSASIYVEKGFATVGGIGGGYRRPFFPPATIYRSVIRSVSLPALPRLFSRVASNYSDTHASDHASRYSLIDMQGFNGPIYNTAIKAAGASPGIYKNQMMIGPGTTSGSSLNTTYAVSATEGVDWGLGVGWNSGELADVGNTDFQNLFASNTIIAANTGGFEWVFIDDLHWKGVTLPAGWDFTRWQAATLSFLINVCPQLQAAGLEVIGNVSSACADAFKNTLPSWYAWMDGWMDEGIGRADTSHSGPRDTGAWITNRLTCIAASEAAGKKLMSSIPADDTDFTLIEYGIGIILICSNCGGLTTTGVAGTAEVDFSHYGHEVWTPIHDRAVSLGAPIAAPVGNVTVGFSRQFTNGIVRLNPTTTTQTILGVSMPSATATVGT